MAVAIQNLVRVTKRGKCVTATRDVRVADSFPAGTAFSAAIQMTNDRRANRSFRQSNFVFATRPSFSAAPLDTQRVRSNHAGDFGPTWCQT
jgi:hypothetical protein